MKNSLSFRLDETLLSMLSEGAERTPLKKPELIRRTLRLHLHDVIEAEARGISNRLTRIAPWPRGALARAYDRAGRHWDTIESAALAAQGPPSWGD